MSKKVLIIGGMGSGSSIAFAMIDANLRGDKTFEFMGFVNDRDKTEKIEGYPVLGGLKDIPRLIKEGYYFINNIGRMGAQKQRIELIESLNIPDERFFTFIHPLAYVAPEVTLGVGCVVMPNVNISPRVKIGKCTRIMSNAFIGYDTNAGNYCLFSGASCTGSHLQIGDGVFVGFNATLKECLSLGNYSVVGMGAVLTKSIQESEVWAGNPAKLFKTFE